jgi:hypothetical protein
MNPHPLPTTRIRTNFNHPCKEIWVVQKGSNVTDQVRFRCFCYTHALGKQWFSALLKITLTAALMD